MAMSSAFSMIVSNTDRRISPRSRAGVAAHDSCTAQAASRAAIASEADASATDSRTSSVAGFTTSNVDAAGRSSPPIHRPVGTDANTRETSGLAIGQ